MVICRGQHPVRNGPGQRPIATRSRFRDANPRVFKAFYDGLGEAIEAINRDKPAAARLYLEMARDTKSSAHEELCGRHPAGD